MLRCIGGRFERRCDADFYAFFEQPLRDDIAVATIIARPAQHQSRQISRNTPDHLRRTLSGPAHQCLNRDPGVDQSLFRQLHFSGGQYFPVIEQVRL